jgi:hypothetical protein
MRRRRGSLHRRYGKTSRHGGGSGNVYARLVAAGCEVDHHESDLYVKDSPTARAITQDQNRSFFRSQVDGEMWIELPFLYTPFWARKR